MTDHGPKRADSRRTRERILDAAAGVLAREREPTLAVIADEAGISRATIYRHFSDLDAIRDALMQEVADVGNAIVKDHLLPESEAPFTERILSVLHDAMGVRTRYAEAMAREPVADAGAIAAFTPIASALLLQAQQRGEIRRDLDPELLADALITVGFYAARRVYRDGLPIPDALHIVEVLMRGMEPRGRAEPRPT